MVTVLQIFFVFVLIVLIILFEVRKRRDEETILLPENYRELLNDYVKFYRQLDEKAKEFKESGSEVYL